MKLTVPLFAVLLMLAVCFASCLNSKNELLDSLEQLKKDSIAIDNYLNENGLIAEHDPSGIRMVITKLGKNLPANLNDSVDVDYVGRLFSDGSIFDQGNIKGVVEQYITGWQVALTTLPEGSEATLYIPSKWAYGSQKQTGIPENSILVFAIKFNKVMKTAKQRSRLAADTVLIDNYLTEKGIEAMKDSSGLRYVIDNTTPGETATWYNRLKLKYKIKIIPHDTTTVVSGTRVPSSYFYSRTVDYIDGMKIGLQKLTEGSGVTLYVPSGLGFGSKDAYGSDNQILVPANSNLIIQIQLAEIVK